MIEVVDSEQKECRVRKRRPQVRGPKRLFRSPLVESRKECDQLFAKHYGLLLCASYRACPREWIVRSMHISGFTAHEVLHEAYVRVVQNWRRVPREPGFVPYVEQRIRWRISDILVELERRRRIVERYASDNRLLAAGGEEVHHAYAL